MKKYEVEFYDLKDNCGKDIMKLQDDLNEAKDEAISKFHHLYKTDRAHTAVLVNEYIDNEYRGCVYEVNNENYEGEYKLFKDRNFEKQHEN